MLKIYERETKRDKDFDVIFVIYLHITIVIDFLGIFEYKKGAMCK